MLTMKKKEFAFFESETKKMIDCEHVIVHWLTWDCDSMENKYLCSGQIKKYTIRTEVVDESEEWSSN